MSNECNLCNNPFSDEEMEAITCGHQFCLLCTSNYIKDNLASNMKCPVDGCSEYISESSVLKSLDDNNVKKYFQLTIPQNGIVACLLKECDGVFVPDDPCVFHWCCDICGLFNCSLCNAPHEHMSCEEYQEYRDGEARNICEDNLQNARGRLQERTNEEMRVSLLMLEINDLIPNPNVFECPVCLTQISKRCGIQLRNCFHCFCKPCFKTSILGQNKIPIHCFEADCDNVIQDREIQAVLDTDELNDYHNKGCMEAMKDLKHADKCRSLGCNYIYDIKFTSVFHPKKWTCPSCEKINCLKCKAIHMPDESCKKYREAHPMDLEAETEIENLIKEQKLMRCLSCRLILQKVGGCNYIKCIGCGAELCWITQKYRYGRHGCNCSAVRKCHKDCKGCNPDACLLM